MPRTHGVDEGALPSFIMRFENGPALVDQVTAIDAEPEREVRFGGLTWQNRESIKQGDERCWPHGPPS